MLLAKIITHLESIAHPIFQETYDNCGLLVGNRNMEVTGILVALDSIEAIVDEAIEKKCNLIVAHHPIVFSGLKKINGNSYVERVLIKAIKNDIAIYAIHTNLDHVLNGVNSKICEKIGIQNYKILAPKKGLLRKLVTYCPKQHTAAVRKSLWEAGAGEIGNYFEVSFSAEGIGTFKGNENSNPVFGVKGELIEESEDRLEIIYSVNKETAILSALFKSHPYEEVGYELIPIANSWQDVGSGMIGNLNTPIPLNDFLQTLKVAMNTAVIRYTPIAGKMIAKVAVCGGAGSFLVQDALSAGADILISADFKYHQFFDGEGEMVIADIGHFESEQFTIDLLADLLKQKLPTFAILKTGINTNPITYLT